MILDDTRKCVKEGRTHVILTKYKEQAKYYRQHCSCAFPCRPSFYKSAAPRLCPKIYLISPPTAPANLCCEADGIYVDTLNLMPRLQNQVRSMAAFDNPVFYKNKRLGYSKPLSSKRKPKFLAKDAAIGFLKKIHTCAPLPDLDLSTTRNGQNSNRKKLWSIFSDIRKMAQMY